MALLQDYNKLFEHTDNIKKVYVNNNVVWPAAQKTGPDYTEPFYVENITNNNETVQIWKNSTSSPTIDIYTSTDKTTWTLLGSTSRTALTISLTPGDKVYLRAETNAWNYNRIRGCSKVGGNIMSLLYGSTFTGRETAFPTTDRRAFYLIFYQATTILDGESLLLPVTELTQECYAGLFNGCSNLLYGPALPATTLANNCYEGFFTACSNLIAAPELPATTLVSNCYKNLFLNCRNINYVKCLATTLAGLGSWLNGVSSTGTFVKKAGVTWPTGVSGIPSGWTVEEV